MDIILKVHGTSMTKAGIADGDLVIVRPTKGLVDGAIMAVKFQGNSFIKRIHVIKHNVRLFSEDGSGDSITTRLELIEPQGVVVGSLRRF